MTRLTASTAGTFVSNAGVDKAANTTRSSIDIFVGSRLRGRRISRGMSEKELSEKLGVDLEDVHAYEYGATRIGANLLLRIAKLLEVRPDYFFQGYAPDVASWIRWIRIISQEDAYSSKV